MWLCAGLIFSILATRGCAGKKYVPQGRLGHSTPHKRSGTMDLYQPRMTLSLQEQCGRHNLLAVNDGNALP